MKNMKRMKRITVTGIFCILVLSQCSSREEPGKIVEKPLRVVTTTGMLADAVRNVGGDKVTVEALMGTGLDPHTYKATEGDMLRLYRADLILYNGLHLEAKMADVLEKFAAQSHTVAIAEKIPPKKLRTDAQTGAHDPHVWFDISLWKDVVYAIADELCKADPAHKEQYRTRAKIYMISLNTLEEYVKRVTATVPQDNRVLVTAHDAFGYFGNAYNFHVRGIQGISTVTEAGVADMRGLAVTIAEEKIPAIFVETSVSPKTINALKEAVKAKGWDVNIGGNLFSDAMGSAGTKEGTYIGMVHHNVKTIVHALGGTTDRETNFPQSVSVPEPPEKTRESDTNE